MVPLRFNFAQLKDLDDDFKASEKAIPIIAQKVLKAQLGPLRSELRGMIPRATGRLQRSFGFSIRRTKGNVTARFGFLLNKRVSASTAIAANVLQAGGAHPRKGKYLWIPFRQNRAADGSALTTPRQLIDAGGFIAVSKSGNKIAFQRSGVPAFVLKTFVKLSRPPVPIEQRTEAALPQITGDIEDTIGAVIEAKKTAQSVL